MLVSSIDKKKRDPAVSDTTTIFPYLLHFTLVIGFLWTLNAFIKTNFLSYKPTNLTIPSEKPTTRTRPLFFFENGNQSIQVAWALVANLRL